MSATNQMRAMLDQLMGTGRDGEAAQRQKYKYTDNKVCKSFLLDCCPHDILASTRMDIGECDKVHDLALRADYEAAAKTKEHAYELDALDHLTRFVADADRKTENSKNRLIQTQEELTSEAAVKLEKVHELAEEIGKKIAASEKLGEEGKVDESMAMMEEVEKIKKEKQAAESEYRSSMPASSYQQQKLRVCEVCSALLGIHDNDRRLADHFGGKLHLGFIDIRDKLESLKKLVSEKRASGLFDRVDDSRGERGFGGFGGRGGGGRDRRMGGGANGRDDRYRRDREEEQSSSRGQGRGYDNRDRRRRSRSRDRGDRGRRRDRFSRSPDAQPRKSNRSSRSRSRERGSRF